MYLWLTNGQYATTRLSVMVMLVLSAELLQMHSAYAGSTNYVALVVGIGNYDDKPLDNPVNDAQAIGDAFREIGYSSVTVLKDAEKEKFREALDNFDNLAGGSDVAVIFYAGHGIQVDGENYLIPGDIKIGRRKSSLRQLISLSELTDIVEKASNLGLVILDACRNNPYAKSFGGESTRGAPDRGLIRVEPEQDNILVAYATKAGETADDGSGANSPYTSAILKYLREPLEIAKFFRKVTGEVRRLTGGYQKPYTYGSLTDGEYFLGAKFEPDDSDIEKEIIFWRNVKATNTEDLYRAYLNKYSDGLFVENAKWNIAKLRDGGNTQSQPISREDREVIHENFENLKKAIQSESLSGLRGLTNQSSERMKMFTELFSDYSNLRLELVEIEFRKLEQKVSGVIRILSLNTAGGKKANVPAQFKSIPINSVWTNDGWSRINW